MAHTDDGRRRTRWFHVSLVAVASGALLLHVATTGRLGRTGVLHEWDVLFSADPTVYVTSFTTGQNTYRWGGRSFVHPNVSNIIYPIVAVTAATTHALWPSVPEVTAGRRLAYLICPTASAVTGAVLLLTLGELGIGLLESVLLVIVYVLSFSDLVFGSLPESYCLSGLGLATLFLIAVRTARSPSSRASRDVIWVAVGTILTSITITNLAAFGLVAAAIRRRRASTAAALRWASGVSACALAATVGLYAIGARLSPHAPAFTPFASGQIIERHGFDLAGSLLAFPLAVTNSIAPPVPLRGEADPSLRQVMRFTLTYAASPAQVPGQWWRGAAMLIVLALAGVCAARLAPWQRSVFIAAALVLGFNWLLHAFYGSELFLYSQHWEIAVLVMLAALAALPTGRLVRGVFVLAVGLCVWNSVYVWRATVHMLESPSHSVRVPSEPGTG